MHYLGVDYGERRVGIAASDERGVFAFARGTLPNDDHLIDAIRAHITKEGSDAIIVGIPQTADGAHNPVEAAIRDFAHTLSEESALPVMFQDESWSSRESSRFSPDGVKDDAASAAIILQRYLDAHPAGQ